MHSCILRRRFNHLICILDQGYIYKLQETRHQNLEYLTSAMVLVCKISPLWILWFISVRWALAICQVFVKLFLPGPNLMEIFFLRLRTQRRKHC